MHVPINTNSLHAASNAERLARPDFFDMVVK